MDSLNWIAIIGVTLLGFILGPIWYGPIFGKTWAKIHGMDCDMDEATKKKMMKGMWKLMLSEFIATLLITTGLACIIRAIPEYSGIQSALMVWVAFILPMCVSNVIWGADKKSDMPKKIAIMVAYRLVFVLIAGYILGTW